MQQQEAQVAPAVAPGLQVRWASAAVGRWASLGFGPIEVYDVLRILVLSLTAIAVAVQLAASGFLASVFTIRR